MTYTKHVQPLFKVSAIDENDHWNAIVDFTQLKKKGVAIEEILSRLRQMNKSSKKWENHGAGS